MKRCACFLLALLLLAGQLSPAVFAEEGEEAETVEPVTVTVSSTEDFLRFASACSRDVYSIGVVFSLSADIDLSGSTFDGIPYFAGTFLGNGHSILGLDIHSAGSRVGLFRRIAEGAVVQDLHVTGRVQPSGTRVYVGGLAGVNDGQLISCSFNGTVSALENVGGLVGMNGPTGLVDDCSFSGSVTAEHQVGGIVGENDGVVSRCVSSGLVNTEAIVPQSETHFDLAILSEDSFLDLTNIGGIAGNNEGVISACRNDGAAGYKYSGYNVGGIAGKSSGYITGCINTAEINGRRDTGGIVGQLIPSVTWDFTNDKLEALSGQLGSMNYLISKASQHATENSGELASELSRLYSSNSTALSELEALLRSYEGNDRRILDSIHVDPETGAVTLDNIDLSGVNTSRLTSALADMNAEVSVLSGILQSSFSETTEDLAKIVKQMSGVLGGMYSLLQSTSGGDLITTVDLSSEESYEHDIGAVDGCSNYGRILAENNAGGIAGTVGYEVSFDMEDTLDASRFVTADVSRYLFAVVRSCESYCEVQTKGDDCGGAVGALDAGAVVDCVGAGAFSSLNGDYVGGIAGQAQGTIRACWSRSVLTGSKYVGGIVGLGQDLDSCRSWAHIESASEYAGAVAGWAEGEVSGNLYVDESPVGIDNVSLSGMTDPVNTKQLTLLDDCPDNFGDLSVRFVVGDKTVATVDVPFGGSVETLPEVANDGERYWKWDDFSRDHVYYSMTVTGKYYAPGTTLSSGEEIPLFLVEGVFYEGQALTVASYPAAEQEEEVLAAYTLYVDGYDGDLTVHMRTEDTGRICLADPSGALNAVPSRIDGQYLVFAMPNGGSFVYLRSEPLADHRGLIACGVAVVFVLILGILFVRGKKKKSEAAVSNAGTAPKADALQASLSASVDADSTLNAEVSDSTGKSSD